MDKVKGLLNESDYTEMTKDFMSNRDRLEKLITQNEKQIAELDEKIAVGDNRRELIEQYANLKHLTREMVVEMIDYIIVGKRLKGMKHAPVEIHWNF